MLLRSAEAGEIEVLLQVQNAGPANVLALPHVSAEGAEDLFIQTGVSHERRLAARRAALRCFRHITYLQ
jgi:hypothetical protein